jgi:hypothetical protein
LDVDFAACFFFSATPTFSLRLATFLISKSSPSFGPSLHAVDDTKQVHFMKCELKCNKRGVSGMEKRTVEKNSSRITPGVQLMHECALKRRMQQREEEEEEGQQIQRVA